MIINIIGNIVILFFVYLWGLHRGKIAHEIITDWANENNFKLLSAEYIFHLYSSFTTSPLNMLYKVEILDLNIDMKKKYELKMGSYFYGMLLKEDRKVRINHTYN